jgi:hypothetical protein
MLTGRDRTHHGEIMPEAIRPVEAGKRTTSVDEQRFGLGTALAAHEFVQSGKALGKVVVDIAD